MREAVTIEISNQLSEVLSVIERHLESTLLAVHLYGSAVDGGLVVSHENYHSLILCDSSWHLLLKFIKSLIVIKIYFCGLKIPIFRPQ